MGDMLYNYFIPFRYFWERFYKLLRIYACPSLWILIETFSSLFYFSVSLIYCRCFYSLCEILVSDGLFCERLMLFTISLDYSSSKDSLNSWLFIFFFPPVYSWAGEKDCIEWVIIWLSCIFFSLSFYVLFKL